MKYIEANLTAIETMRAFGRVHWFVFVSGAVVGLLGVVFLFQTLDLSAGKPPNAGSPGLSLILGVLGAWLTITVYQGLMGRLFDFGTLTIRGAGGGQTPVATIAHPLEFRRVVQEQIAKASRGSPEFTTAYPPAGGRVRRPARNR